MYEKIKNSIYGPELYSNVIENTERKTGLGHLLRVTTVVGVIVGISLLPTLMNVKTVIVDTLHTAASYYPESLTLSVTNGVLSTSGVTEPFFVALPNEEIFKDATFGKNTEPLVNAVVIDTQTPFTIEYFKSLHTFALLQKTSVSMLGDNGEIKTHEFAKDMNGTLTKVDVSKLESTIAMYIERVAPILYVLIIPIIIAALFIGYMIYGIYFALVTWIFARFALGEKWSFKNSYRVGIHAMTLAILIINIVDIVKTIRIPFVFTCISLLVLFVNTRNRNVAQLPVPPEIASVK